MRSESADAVGPKKPGCPFLLIFPCLEGRRTKQSQPPTGYFIMSESAYEHEGGSVVVKEVPVIKVCGHPDEIFQRSLPAGSPVHVHEASQRFLLLLVFRPRRR